ncbi:MAG: hypothetical protein U0T33_11825 [Bacteroidales bacterium]
MDIEKTFTGLGGTFRVSPAEIKKILPGIKAFVFDWDGVFNNGLKTGDAGSPFSEIDSMGINLLRFSTWLKSGSLPYCFIITGMNNSSAAGYAKREHFHGIVMNLKKKKLALDIICSNYNIKPSETAFLWDDVIDIEIARACGLSIYIGRQSNPLFRDYVIRDGCYHYITGSSGETHAIREITELLIGLNGNFDETIENRVSFSPLYEKYLYARDQVITDTTLH